MASKKLTFDSFEKTTNNKPISIRNPWFRVKGQRGTYQFSRYVENGKRKWVEAFGPDGWRAFYVGEKPYTKMGLRITPYKLRACKGAETPTSDVSAALTTKQLKRKAAKKAETKIRKTKSKGTD